MICSLSAFTLFLSYFWGHLRIFIAVVRNVIAKVIEVSSESTKSFDDAAKNAVTEVSKTVDNVKHVYVKDFEIYVDDDGSHVYRTNCKVTFVVNEVS